ncbi:transposase-like protein [Bradyrhizobium sp. S3.3.6]|uniref:helix-turn-helix domain-containing protein n=1 Tax=Bradyrhizobium TaxID=374 RepID=UPI001652BA09|nr:helix-turn-helix domain-containing protein [Bradyrhizobium rifense]
MKVQKAPDAHRQAMVRSVVQGGLSKADAAYQFNTTRKTIAKWVERFRRRCGAGITHEANGLLTIQRRGLGKTNIYELYLTVTSDVRFRPDKNARSRKVR